MKRNCDEMDTTSNDNSTEALDKLIPAKRLKDDAPDVVNDLNMMDTVDEPNVSETMLLNVFRRFIGSGQHSLVEREPSPAGQPLVNPGYVGKKTYQDLMELDANTANASQFVLANMGNRVDQVGRQMKHLHENLQEIFRNVHRDSELHMAACNFVKKPGQTYHLYERQSGQKYFSMLSPQDWNGNSPHAFLGSWYLESDQSWTPAEERHLRFEGVNFIRKLYSIKSIQ